MADPFDTLGVLPEFDVDLGALEKRYRDLSRVLHPDRHVAGSAGERRLALGKAVEVNEAWRIVRDPLLRAEAILRRRGSAAAEQAGAKADPAFLMDMLEQREELTAARRTGDAPAVARLAASISARREAAVAKLRALLAEQTPSADRAVVPVLGELRYYQRFLDEVSAIDDERADAAP